MEKNSAISKCFVICLLRQPLKKLFSNFIPLPNYYLHSLVQNFSRQIKISFDYISSGQRIWKKWA